MAGSGSYHITLQYSRRREVRVNFNPDAYARTAHADQAEEAGIADRWDAAVAANQTLFNGRKFRYAGHEASDSAVTIKLGLTDYRTFLGTHGLGWPLRCTAMPLGNIVVVETTDGMTPLLVRSSIAAEGRGALVFPGGHPEPDAAKLAGTTVCAGDVERVTRELWEGAWREVLEELFVTEEQLGPTGRMRFLGLVARASDGKVSMTFAAAVSVTSDVVRAQYEAANAAKEESVALLLKPLTDLKCILDEESVDGFRPMPELLGAAKLWVDMDSNT